MAHITLDTAPALPRNLFSRALSAVGQFLVRSAENNPRVRQMQALSQLSDKQLADLGIKREDIPMHVFGGWV